MEALQDPVTLDESTCRMASRQTHFTPTLWPEHRPVPRPHTKAGITSPALPKVGRRNPVTNHPNHPKNLRAVLEEKKKGVRGEDTNMSHGKRTAVVRETDARLVPRASGDRTRSAQGRGADMKLARGSTCPHQTIRRKTPLKERPECRP